MSFEDLIYSCRKLVSAYEICDELWFMRLYNEDNYKAFDEYMVQKIKRIKELCEEELEKNNSVLNRKEFNDKLTDCKDDDTFLNNYLEGFELEVEHINNPK